MLDVVAVRHVMHSTRRAPLVWVTHSAAHLAGVLLDVPGAVHGDLERVRERQQLHVDGGEGVDVPRLTCEPRDCVVASVGALCCSVR